MPRRKEKNSSPRRIAADDEARGRRFYERQDSLPRETERNPGFLSRIGAARDGTDEDERVSAAFSLSLRDLISHSFVLHGGWLEADGVIDHIYDAVADAAERLMEQHGYCFPAVAAAFADYLAYSMSVYFDQERHQDGCACDCCRREDAE
jgi:hypothetical protein